MSAQTVEIHSRRVTLLPVLGLTRFQKDDGFEIMDKIKPTILAHLDLDWFAVDCLGNLGHFTSNATIVVPLAVKAGIESKDERGLWRDLADRMFELPVKPGSSTVHLYAEEWQPELKLAEESKRDAYYGASTEWSDRGFFSFDCVRELGGDPYFLVSSPSNPLCIADIPSNDRLLIEAHRFSFEFSSCESIAADLILGL